MRQKIRIKICCISSVDEARSAIAAGASAIGLVGPMPGGPGIIDDDLIRNIASVTPPPIATFLLTSETSVDNIVAHHQRTLTNTIQLVDALQEGTHRELKERLPGIKIVQVIHILDESSIDEAIDVSRDVDALLLDSGNPNLEVKELGGTGRVHNWNLSREIVKLSEKPVFLAGGLDAGNVRTALTQVQPFGVDLCSGVRSNSKLDSQKLENFMRELDRL